LFLFDTAAVSFHVARLLLAFLITPHHDIPHRLYGPVVINTNINNMHISVLPTRS